MRAAYRAAAAAEGAALGKDGSRAAQAKEQVKIFCPLAIKAGGAANERSREFLVTFTSSPPPLPPGRPIFLG